MTPSYIIAAQEPLRRPQQGKLRETFGDLLFVNLQGEVRQSVRSYPLPQQMRLPHIDLILNWGRPVI